MNNKHLLLIALSTALGATVCDMVINERSTLHAARKRKRGRRRRKKAESTQAPASQAAGRSLKAGSNMTIAQILSEVQKRSSLSHFAVATANGVVIKGDPVAGKINGSRSVVNAGLSPLFQDETALNKQVTLKNDPALVKRLGKQKRLVKKTKKRYGAILLYFEHDGYRFYVVDPYPGKVVRGRMNPAAKILERW